MSGIKDTMKKAIARKALGLFLTNSITNVKISDIAKEADVGEATVYRYFSTKQNLVLNSALILASNLYSNYFEHFKGNTGYEKIESFYNFYLEIYKNNNNYFKFLNEFDAFIIGNKSKIKIEEYEEKLFMYKTFFINNYELGLEDGSVKKIDDIDIFYYGTTHALMELCKKLASADIVKFDEQISKEKEIKTVIEVVLSYLKK